MRGAAPVLAGSSNRSSCDRLVRIASAVTLLPRACCYITRATGQALDADGKQACFSKRRSRDYILPGQPGEAMPARMSLSFV